MFDDDEGEPPWLYLVDDAGRAWREKQLAKGRDPDPYMEKVLREQGIWPPADKARSDA
jgi:hypothetical protein